MHRSQLEQAAGDWRAAMSSAQLACQQLRDPPHPALGLAYYQAGDLARLVGDVERAEHDYGQASRYGHDPVPGLALLQLDRGDSAAAHVTIRRALSERGASAPRPELLSGAIEVFRSAGDLAAARECAEKLADLAGASTSPVLAALSAQASGAVLLATGDLSAAVGRLRAAAGTWRTLRMPYDLAKTALLLGLVCAAMGDHASAKLEFDSATEGFTQLGALPDARRAAALVAGLTHEPGAALSAREQQVLVHLAAGRTNRQIADTLFVSPHTVARHIEHIYAKLGVTNRAAATAYAYEHHLV